MIYDALIMYMLCSYFYHTLPLHRAERERQHTAAAAAERQSAVVAAAAEKEMTRIDGLIIEDGTLDSRCLPPAPLP